MVDTSWNSRNGLKAKALRDRVRFRGQLTTPVDVRAELDRADLFVLPSRQEGLPRAMIEAMARALPCIGSSVGGIPELLQPKTSCRLGMFQHSHLKS